MLILEESEYGCQVPIQMRTLHLDKIIDLISKDEIDIQIINCNEDMLPVGQLS